MTDCHCSACFEESRPRVLPDQEQVLPPGPRRRTASQNALLIVSTGLFIVGSFTFLWYFGKYVLVPGATWLTDTFGWWLVVPALLVLWLVGRREKRRAS